MSQRSETIRLLYLLPTYTFGGAERTSLNLLTGLDKKRFRICLVTSRSVYQHFQHLELEKFLAVEDLGIDVWFGSVRRFLGDVKRVSSLLRGLDPDLAFGMMHYPSALLVFAKKFLFARVKIIASPRGPSTEYLRHFEPNPYRKRYLKAVFGFFCRHADGLVVSSQGMREECIRDFHALPGSIAVIPNSVHIDDIARKAAEDVDLDIPPGFGLISTSGRLSREKNILFLLEAFAAVRKRAEAKLLILGDGPDRQDLERRTAELALDGDVMFVGYQGNPYKFVRRSDVFVHTCLFEGFANVIIEAMACGVPVVAMDCPYGPRDIVNDGKDGLLVPMNDEKALADAIVRLLGDGALRTDLGRQGSLRAREFSLDRMVGRYQEIFEEVLERDR